MFDGANSKTHEDHEHLNEVEFLYILIRPLLKSSLEKFPDFKIKCGEPFLKCAAENENAKLNDDERRSSGAKIDLIVKSLKYKFEISVLEISGLIDKVDNRHFLGDRRKIALNLKYILKQIVGACPNASHTLIKDFRVYGFQVYHGQFYIYSMISPCPNSYVFSSVINFPVPLNPTLFKVNAPKFLGRFSLVAELVNETMRNIDEIYNDSLDNSIPSSSDSDTAPEVSPKKKQKQKQKAKSR